ncbi:DEAD/DEAH box RNA helicase [Thraustotheca clavata]|uniref:ATP-dependent RNA helicase n=1 Tax=Thraustotheca clavata TaxID=74557 RepID=A0A1W0A224_9STRA|nr:DEAD/DEAH box RNA helicase [Thraustotheca clavata]
MPRIGSIGSNKKSVIMSDGFSLNIAVGTAPKAPVKRKVVKFRQKKVKAKQAKAKTQKNQSKDGGSVKIQRAKPLIQQVSPIKETPVTVEKEPIEKEIVAEEKPIDDAKPEEKIAPKQTLIQDIPEMKKSVVDNSTKKNNGKLGSRRNPNKESYSAEALLRPTIDMSKVTVHEAPVKSSTSKEIFSASTFENLKLHPHLVTILTKPKENGGFGFDKPTRVQVKSVPAIAQTGDVLLKSETGSGKTLAFCLPMVHRLMSKQPRINRTDGCLAMILAPTRELCTQIQETLERLLKVAVYIVAGSVVGGEKKKSEKARLRKGVSILVATPGRLVDHLTNTHSFHYNKLEFLILDEADRLLDMGFERSITQILEFIASKKDDDVVRQTILVSATINSGVERLAAMSLTSPRFIDADTKEQAVYATPEQLVQHFMIVPAKQRLCALSSFLRSECKIAKASKIVVFLSTCDAVDFMTTLFQKCTWPQRNEMFGPAIFRLHGNVNQQERTSTFQAFCKASAGILFCTDVAARGLNLPTVQWIVQYDPPTETRDYVHRVGRTARSGAVGNSLLFLLPSEAAYCEHLQEKGLNLTALNYEATIARSASKGEFRSSQKKALHEVIVHELQYLFEQSVLADTELFDMACQAFQSFVRSYATHASETRQYFHVRSLHFGHVAKSFGLREPPASTKVTKASQQAKGGTLKKRKEREQVDEEIKKKKQKKIVQTKRAYNHHNVGVFTKLVVLIWLGVFALVVVRLSLLGLHKLHYACTARVPALTYQYNHVMDHIVRGCSLLRLPYHPTWYLFNGHLQTALVAVEEDEPHVPYRRELFELSDGGVLSLDWVQLPSVSSDDYDKPTIMILHGLAGGSHEKYVRHTVVELLQSGWQVVVMNARGCGKTKVVTPKLFCAAYTQDVREVTAYLRQQHVPTSPLIGLGFSLGSNILTKFVGEEGNECLLTAMISVGNPYCLTTSSNHLMGTWFYRHTYNNIMTKNLIDVVFHQTNAHEVFQDHPEVDLDHLRTSKNLREYDDRFTRRVFGYDTVSEFYREASCVPYIKHITIPTFFLSAYDDPICVHQGIPYEDCAANPNVLLAVTHAGGHLGFYSGTNGHAWSPSVIAEYCNTIHRLVSTGVIKSIAAPEEPAPVEEEEEELETSTLTMESEEIPRDEPIVPLSRDFPTKRKLVDEITDVVAATLDDMTDTLIQHATVDTAIYSGLVAMGLYYWWWKRK